MTRRLRKVTDSCNTLSIDCDICTKSRCTTSIHNIDVANDQVESD